MLYINTEEHDKKKIIFSRYMYFSVYLPHVHVSSHELNSSCYAFWKDSHHFICIIYLSSDCTLIATSEPTHVPWHFLKAVYISVSYVNLSLTCIIDHTSMGMFCSFALIYSEYMNILRLPYWHWFTLACVCLFLFDSASWRNRRSKSRSESYLCCRIADWQVP